LHIISGDIENCIIHWQSKLDNIIHGWKPLKYKVDDAVQIL